MTKEGFQFVKIGSAVPEMLVADCATNTKGIIKKIEEAQAVGIQALCFPELSISGYSCGDLFFQRALLEDCLNALAKLVETSKSYNILIVIGSPLEVNNGLYNCAIAILKGEILGVVPKTFIPNHNEFYEKRWFSSSLDLQEKTVELVGQEVPIGKDLLFNINDYKIGIELCEDLWTPIPPSSLLCLQGADIIFNLSASNETIAKRNYRKNLILQQSGACLCAYLYCSAGWDESTTDLVFSGHCVISENGHLLAESEALINRDSLIYTDVDVERLRFDRLQYKSFLDNRKLLNLSATLRTVKRTPQWSWNTLDYPLVRKPFVPNNTTTKQTRCEEIRSLQVAGLKKRILHIQSKTIIIGISGGLDSTLTLLIAVQAIDELHLDRKQILGITMPGFGTTRRTLNNALTLMKELGVSTRTINIGKACQQHFKDIEHDPKQLDITYENTQARERTQILMDIANQTGGFVLGTGDLSELALGWCTFNGDHIAHYAVNSGVPKTLVRSLVQSCLLDISKTEHTTLSDIIDTPISPELLPASNDGKILQITEDTVGPYELHDFFLYYMLRYGFQPEKILYLASIAFGKKEQEIDVIYDITTIKKWLRTFYWRFFSQQFKRNCLPDGPKVGNICLSPRGDWRMPSDAIGKTWISYFDQ